MSVLTPALDKVTWREVVEDLTATADPSTVQWHVDNRHPDLCPAATMRLAVASMLAGEVGTVTAVVAAGGSRDVGLWLHRSAPMVARQTGLNDRPEVTVPGFTGSIFIDPAVHLPEHLRALCGEVADKHGTLVIVRAWWLRPYSRGRSQRDVEVTVGGQRRTVTLVEVKSDDDATVAHELSHLIAPARLRHDEPFAERLGQELLYHRPRTLVDAEVLVDREVHKADAARPPKPLVVPEPTPGWEDAAVRWHDADGIPGDPLHSLLVLTAIGRQVEAAT